MQLQIDNLGKVAVTVEENYWSNTKDYDKLTIVEQEGVFGTFISRKPVPAGMPLTNRKYWIRFSSLKEEIVLQFNEIVNELRELEGTVDKKEAELYKAIASVVAGGVALKQSFGDAEDFGISQKVLTESRDTLQAQIDAIVSEKATVSLAVSTSTFIVGERSFTLTASTNTNANSIVIKQGSTIIATGSGKLLPQTINVVLENAGNIVYTAEFTFAGGNKRLATATVYFVNKVYVGAGNNTEDVAVDANAVSARRSINPNGNNGTNYTVTVTDDKPYVFFIVPASFTDIDHATMNGFTYNLTHVATTVIEGINYKYYRCAVPMDAGTYNILIY